MSYVGLGKAKRYVVYVMRTYGYGHGHGYGHDHGYGYGYGYVVDNFEYVV